MSDDYQTSTSGVFDQNYKGSTYAVKYLGIVDGTMGILSRKMALQTQNASQSYNAASYESNPQSVFKQLMSEDEQQNSKKQKHVSPAQNKNLPSFNPILGSKYASNKRYAEKNMQSEMVYIN